MIGFCTGCGSTETRTGDADSRELRQTGAELFEPGSGGTGVGAAQIETDWAVVIFVFRGSDAMSLAEQGAQKVNSQTRLRARAQLRAPGEAAVVVGRFDSPSEKDAQQTLERVRFTTIEGATPFGSAVLAPPPASLAIPVTRDPIDLRNAAKRAPSAIYTLEVAVYARTDGGEPSVRELGEFRKAAEQAARALRSEGADAYFYHGKTSSSVTVGLYTAQDHDPQDPTGESLALSASRAEHPHLLVNGAGQRRKLRLANGQETYELDPSRLVATPR